MGKVVVRAIQRVLDYVCALLRAHGGHWVLGGTILGVLWRQRLDKWAKDCRGGNSSSTIGSEGKRGEQYLEEVALREGLGRC